MAVRLLTAAVLLLPLASVPAPLTVSAADEPAPVLKLRTELGGGDTSWGQQAVYAPDGKTLYAMAVGPNAGLVYVIDPVAGQKLATLKADPPADVDRRYSSGFAISPDGKFLAIAYQLMQKDAGAGVKEAGWELVLWDLAARKVAATKRGERWELHNLTFSPDGKRLAANTAGYDKAIDGYKSVALVWDVPGLEQKHAFEARGHSFSAMAFAREGGADVLRAFHGGPVLRWDLATGKQLETVAFDYGRRIPTRSAFSPDSKTLAVLSEVVDATTQARVAAEVSLFDAQKGGKARSVARGHKGEASGITYSRDGKLIATSSFRAADTVVWDADNLAILATLPTYGQLAFAPDGRTLNVGGTGFWSVEGRHLFTMGRHATQVWAVAADPKGWGFASAQNVPFVRFWDRATLKNTLNVSLDPNGRTIRSIAYSADGVTLAAVDGDKVKLIDPSSGWVRATAEGHTGRVNAVAFSPDGKHFASASGGVTGSKLGEPKLDPGEVIIWTFERETRKVKPVHTIKAAHPAGTFCLAFSPDGKTLATGSGDPAGGNVGAIGGPDPPAGATEEAVRLWDVATGKKTAAFPCDPRHHVNALAFSPDGKTLAHTGIDGTRVRLLDLTTGKERALLQAPTQALAFSPDGKLLAAVGSGGKGNGQGLVELRDAATGEKVAAEVRHEQVVNCVAFSPDGKALVTGSSDGVLNLWDVNARAKAP